MNDWMSHTKRSYDARSGWAPRLWVWAGGGLGSGVIIGNGRCSRAAHNLRREGVTVGFEEGRRAHAEVARPTGPRPGGTRVDTAIRRYRLGTRRTAGARGAGARGSQSRRPGARVTRGYVRRGSAAFVGRAGRRIRGAIEHTAPLPVARPAVRWWTPRPLLGLNSPAPEGGLILAIALRGGGDRALAMAPRRGGYRVPAWRGGGSSARGAAHAPRGGPPEREGLLVRGIEAGARGLRGIERGDLLVAAAGGSWTAWTHSTRFSTASRPVTRSTDRRGAPTSAA